MDAAHADEHMNFIWGKPELNNSEMDEISIKCV